MSGGMESMDWDEKRMDTIGQNGNTAEHYNDLGGDQYMKSSINSATPNQWDKASVNRATVRASRGKENQIGDVNSNEKGSGARFNNGKADLSLIPLSTMEDEARVWMYGAQKYAAWNWAKGMNWSVPLACALRHLAKFQAGEDLDKETGLPHIAHAMCNLRMLTLYSKTYKEGDDRPKEWLNHAE